MNAYERPAAYWAIALGGLAGLIVDAAVNAANYPTSLELRNVLLGPWGLLSGSVAALTAFGLTLGLTSRGSFDDQIGWGLGWVIATMTFALFAILMMLSASAWAAPKPAEVLFLYFLAIVMLVGSVLTSLRAIGRAQPRSRLP